MKNVIKWSLLLLLCVLPLQLSAKTHYDAGFLTADMSTDIGGVTLHIYRLRIYNYQGDNSHFSSDGVITVEADGGEHVFHFSDLSREYDEKTSFYYDGEGDDHRFKSANISFYKYNQTQNGIRVNAYFFGQHNSQAISPDDAVGYTSGTSDKWSVVDLYIKVFFKSQVTIRISATWRDHSDGINDDHEPVEWTFRNNRGATDIDAVESLDAAEPEYYDLSGRRLNGPQRGTNIMKCDGKTTKVIIK